MNTFIIENEDGSQLEIETYFQVRKPSRMLKNVQILAEKQLSEAEVLCMIRDAINENRIKILN